MKTDILGVEFDTVTMDEAVARGLDALSGPRGGAAEYIVTPNPEIVRVCADNPAAKTAVNSAFLVLADGIGIIYAAKILGKPVKTRVTGIGCAERLLEGCAQSGYGVFLLGAKPGVAEKAAERLQTRYAGLRIAGCADGFFSDDAAVIRNINAARADLLFVCLGAPKQELWIAKHAGALDVKLAMCLGGALDVFAGNVKRAPVFMQKLGIEWLYRLCREPRRIGRMIKLPLFLVSAFAARINGSK